MSEWMNGRWNAIAAMSVFTAWGVLGLSSCHWHDSPRVTPVGEVCQMSLARVIANASANRTVGSMDQYNRWLLELLDEVLRGHVPAMLHGDIMVGEHTITIDSGSDELKQLDPCDFDDIEIIRHPEGAEQVQGMAQQKGLGIPVVMSQKYRAEKASGKKLFPLNGRHLPATAVLDMDSSGRLVLRFYHTRHQEYAVLGGEKHALAYDLSTPLHRSLQGKLLERIAFHGLINSDRYLENTGIYLPDVYDPQKIPVVFVHGLKSDPHVWQNAMNEVLRDPVLRKKYQCWYFLYPTGLPVYASAAKLRRMLSVARGHYDPRHQNPRMNRMVLVGHSMGGLLSRMQTIDSRDEIYRAFFTQPLDWLDLKPVTKNLIRESMVFKPVDFVKRVVFVASPHQGSSIAQIPVVRALGMLVNPASTLDAVTMDIRINAHHALHPALHRFSNMGCRSVQTLSPQHPILTSLQHLPMQVPSHSIIARRQEKRELKDTSDGVVAYWSSHVAQASSECVVSGHHGCTRLPEVSAEIMRILRLHLSETNE